MSQFIAILIITSDQPGTLVFVPSYTCLTYAKSLVLHLKSDSAIVLDLGFNNWSANVAEITWNNEDYDENY